MVKKLYNVNPPIHMRDSLMTSAPFYVPNTAAGLKTAAFLDDCSLEEKTQLFKTAVEQHTSDLSDAYVKMKRKVEKEDDLEMEDEEYDTSDEGTFMSLGDDDSDAYDEEE